MNWFKSKVSTQVWNESMIRLYEKQMAARAALGAQYLCHPTREVRKLPKKGEVTAEFGPVPTLRLVKS